MFKKSQYSCLLQYHEILQPLLLDALGVSVTPCVLPHLVLAPVYSPGSKPNGLGD